MGERSYCGLIWLFPVVASLIVGPGASSGAPAPRRQASVVTVIVGRVTVIHPSAPRRPLTVGESLDWGDVVETATDGTAQILVEQKATVTVRELSRLQLQQEALATGVWYAAELVCKKIRSSVDRALMRTGEQAQGRSRNAVASVRG